MKKMNLQDVILGANYNEQIDEVVWRGEERERERDTESNSKRQSVSLYSNYQRWLESV